MPHPVEKNHFPDDDVSVPVLVAVYGTVWAVC